jgi:hypothetical protein
LFVKNPCDEESADVKQLNDYQRFVKMKPIGLLESPNVPFVGSGGCQGQADHVKKNITGINY